MHIVSVQKRRRNGASACLGLNASPYRVQLFPEEGLRGSRLCDAWDFLEALVPENLHATQSCLQRNQEASGHEERSMGLHD